MADFRVGPAQLDFLGLRPALCRDHLGQQWVERPELPVTERRLIHPERGSLRSVAEPLRLPQHLHIGFTAVLPPGLLQQVQIEQYVGDRCAQFMRR
jgi:hypothetical protein